MWLFYVITFITFIVVVWIACRFIKNKKDSEIVDTIYYKVSDISGNESIIHDSGIKPSEIVPNSKVIFQLLKEEYHDGVSRKNDYPYSLKIGYNPKNLFEAQIQKIDEEDILYKIEFEFPNTNPFYKKQKTD
jgi:hypothetical protein